MAFSLRGLFDPNGNITDDQLLNRLADIVAGNDYRDIFAVVGEVKKRLIEDRAAHAILLPVASAMRRLDGQQRTNQFHIVRALNLEFGDVLEDRYNRKYRNSWKDIAQGKNAPAP